MTWSIIALIYLAVSSKMKKVRSSFQGVMASFFVWRLQSVFLLMLAYIICMVFILAKLEIWDLSQLKNTIIWTFSVAFMLIFQINAIKKDKDFFKHTVIDNLKLVVVLEYLIGFYSFSLIVELVILPILTILILLIAVAETDERYSQIRSILNGIIGIFGLYITAYTAYRLNMDIDSFANEKTLYDFSIPPVLTILFLPYIFCLMVYMTYENVLIRLEIFINNPRQRLFAIFIAMLAFNVRIELLERWASSLSVINIDSYRDVWDSILKIFKMRVVEKQPPVIDIWEGWSPYIAKEIMVPHGIDTGFYHEAYGEWFAVSPPVNVSDSWHENNIVYYIEGDKRAAKRLKLQLYINATETAEIAHERFMLACRTMYEFAIGSKFPHFLEQALLKGNKAEEVFEYFSVSVTKENFTNTNFKGYDVKFTITKL